jgi:peptide-methionine (S)-S-oxide reductase
MKKIILALAFFTALIASGQTQKKPNAGMNDKTSHKKNEGISLATFGAGCFWCTEAVFLSVKGVEKVESGYMGGKIKNPTYAQVSTGQTGYAEVTQIYFDPRVVTYENLLEFFWNTHDPTTLNRQGADEGTQYTIPFCRFLSQRGTEKDCGGV